MMMAPSTISPKSSAPRLMRLALILPSSMPMAVISIVMGMTSAVITRGAEVAEHHEQHEHHQERAQGEIGGDRVDGGVDQLGAVENRPRPDARRQA